MRIELRRPEVGMSQHLLDAAQVGASFEEVRGERVAQEVRVDAPRVETGLRRQALEHEEGAGAGEGASLGVEEELGATAAIEVRPAAGEVPAEGFGGLPPERDEALLVTL